MKIIENIHLYPSPFTNETRVLRITKTLVDKNIFKNILVVASQSNKSLLIEENIDSNRAVYRVPSNLVGTSFIFKIIFFFQWYLKALFYTKSSRPKCVNAHSLSVLPLGVIYKLIYKCKLVYDAHEIETETQEVVGLRRYFSKIVEKTLINFVDNIILTSPGHADWYLANYKRINVQVIENFPYKRRHGDESQDIFREKFSIPDEDLIFIYQGYLSEPRGVKLILESFKVIDVSKHIIFMGFGELKKEIIQESTRYLNIHFHEAVRPEEVYSYTRCADVGIHMMDDSCINHLYALPNKPLEYMNAGLPAIVSNLPVMGKLINDANSGWLVKPNDEEEFRGIIATLTRQDIINKSQFTHKWSLKNNWENQEIKLESIYKSLFNLI